MGIKSIGLLNYYTCLVCSLGIFCYKCLSVFISGMSAKNGYIIIICSGYAVIPVLSVCIITIFCLLRTYISACPIIIYLPMCMNFICSCTTWATLHRLKDQLQKNIGLSRYHLYLWLYMMLCLFWLY